jgi:hypothetical protein
MTKWILSAIALAVLVPDSASSAEAVPDELVRELRTVSVKRSGEVASVGESAPFPGRKQKDVEFSPRVKEGPHRLDGSLELARSRDGRSLWALRKWDDSTDDANVFRLRGSDSSKLGSAVLQFVDGVWEYVRRDPGSFGRRISKDPDGKLVELFLEAWVALPDHAMIYRPADKKLYPLIPAAGKYDPAVARGVQWMSFSRKCTETGGACVYYGNALDICKRLKNEQPEGDHWIWPTVVDARN